jgi:TM2 domain-containing membrane protein YozV/predicted transcriptional regulator
MTTEDPYVKSVRLAYLFWLPSLFGVAGLQRFYLGKVGTGVLYLLTGGLFGLGTIYDALTLPGQVREAQLYDRFHAALDFDAFGPRGRRVDGPAGMQRPQQQRETIEHTILRVAKKNRGVATPAEVALDGNFTTDEAKEYLEKLVSTGIAEVRVRRSGQLVYVLPDFLDEETNSEFEL